MSGMPEPTPEQLEALQKQMGGAPPGGLPEAPPPGAFDRPPPALPGLGAPRLPGLGAPRLPGLGGGLPGGFNPFGGRKK
jgi:signal recognition particle subunit SRP54